MILAARFPLSIPFKYYIQLLRRGRRFIRKKEKITEIIHKSDISIEFLYKYGRACIRPAILIRLNLALYSPLAKISADP
jgi:hypothetical protein